MHDAINNPAARPVPLTVAGRTYQFHPLTAHDLLVDLQGWVDAQWRDPIDAVRAHIGSGKFTPAQERHLLTAAVEVAARPRPKLGTPEADALLDTFEGMREVVYLGVRKGLPDFTREDAADLLERGGRERRDQILAATNVDLIMSDPKAEAAGGMAPDPTPSPPTGG